MKELDNPFTVKINSKDIEIKVKMPSVADVKEADIHYAKVFKKEVEQGTWIMVQAEKIMKDRNIWTEEMKQEYTEIKKRLLENELIITKRTKSLKKGVPGNADKNTYYGICLEMTELRNRLIELSEARSSLESMTAEGKANNAKINYLIYTSMVYSNSDKRFFSSFEDFDLKTSPTPENMDYYNAIVKASNIFQELYFGLKSNINDILPENNWLIKYGFMDKDYNLINADKKRINRNGELIDEFGRKIDKDGNLIDINGNLYTNNGICLTEPKPFKDDDGNDILDEEYKKELETYRSEMKEWEDKKKTTKED